MLTAGYTVVNSLSGIIAINKAAGAAGAEWEHLDFVSVDVEVATTPAIVRQAVDGLRALGKKVCIYTGAWFWNWLQLQFGGNFDFSDVPAWLADYDGNPALDTPRLGRLGPVIGKQYRGSHDIGGVTVDANTFSDSFIQEDDMDEATVRAIVGTMLGEWARGRDQGDLARLINGASADPDLVYAIQQAVKPKTDAAIAAALGFHLTNNPHGTGGATLDQVRDEIDAASVKAKRE